METHSDIDHYISAFPKDIQKQLEAVRKAIRKGAPEAEEVISYSMPAFKYFGILVYFAAFKSHIGFYPTSSATEAFKTEFAVYKGGKGSVQFPYDQKIPLALITEVTKFRAIENLEKQKLRSKSGKSR
jgi:uncharacterized protein YdhG (YjbR/CyaY superfamily)